MTRHPIQEWHEYVSIDLARNWNSDLYVSMKNIPTNKCIPGYANLSRKERLEIWSVSYCRALKKEKTMWFGTFFGSLLATLGRYIGNKYHYPFVGLAIGSGIGGFIYGKIVDRVIDSYLLNSMTRKKTQANKYPKSMRLH